MRPTFLGPGGIASLDSPGVHFSSTVTILSQTIVPIPQPSLALLTVWFASAFFAVPNDISGGEGPMLTYFLLTAFFLVYVPFSKISHYLYYPFTRYYLGRSLGHRGVYPVRRRA